MSTLPVLDPLPGISLLMTGADEEEEFTVCLLTGVRTEGIDNGTTAVGVVGVVVFLAVSRLSSI